MLGLLACLSLDLQAELARGVAAGVLSALIWSFTMDMFRSQRATISDHDEEMQDRNVEISVGKR